MYRPPGIADGGSLTGAPSVVETQRIANEFKDLPTEPAPTPKFEESDKIGGRPPNSTSESHSLNGAPRMEDAGTKSHALATADHEEKGAAQLPPNDSTREVKDLGWSERHSTENVPNPLVGGIKNGDLWILVRRFNKQMYHVKAIPHAPPGGLDLNIADEEEFSPDKLRGNIERIYMTFIVGIMTFIKHIARLRSWNETKRTAGFCAVYTIAWFLDLLVPVSLAVLISLIISPHVRELLFPHAPLALISSTSGAIQSPPSGQLASNSSLTGAPEKYTGEAVEQEASNFVSSFAAIGLGSAMGKHPPQDKLQTEDGVLDASIPDPTDMTTSAVDAKVSAAGGKTGHEHDKTKKPIEEAMWAGVRPLMHVLGDIADTWERFGNALSPTSPFPKHIYRLRLAAGVAPLLMASIFITPYMVIKTITFGLGFGLFGDPVISAVSQQLNKTPPDPTKTIELRNTILKGVPTNAQLTITLLRIGEANRAPLPPPPRSDEPAPTHPSEGPIDAEDLPMDVTQDEVSAAALPAPESLSNPDDDHEDKPKKKHGSKFIAFFRGAAKAGVSTALGADKVKATTGSVQSKNRLGILLKRPPVPGPTGPVIFEARWKGKVGNLLISTSATPPSVSFAYAPTVTGRVKALIHSGGDNGDDSTDEKQTQDASVEGNSVEVTPVWTIPIPSIAELKKIGGLGWKGRLVVGWAVGTEVRDGLEIVDTKGERVVVTAVPLREELFNRLASIGGQKWESW